MTAAREDSSRGWRAWGIVGVAVAAICGIGWIDRVTGPDIGFSLFYLVPILACGWWVGRLAALITALCAAAAWFAAEIASRPAADLVISLWNGFTRLGIFTALGVLAAMVHQDRRRMAVLLERERTLARTDPLTGLANSRAFFDALGTELARAQRKGHSLCVSYFDLDNFKQVNDHYGHAAGDEALIRTADLIRGALRATDLAARLGGDEIAVLFWDIDRADVERLTGRIVSRVQEVGSSYPAAALGLTAGVAYFNSPPAEVAEIVRRADAAMYEGKAAGKGTVVLKTFD